MYETKRWGLTIRVGNVYPRLGTEPNPLCLHGVKGYDHFAELPARTGV